MSKNNQATERTRRSIPVFAQIINLIPSALAGAAGEACRIKARSFSYAHQIYSLMLGQLCGAFSLNEICDAEEVHRKKLSRVRGMLPARRNTFSHANRTRDPAVAEALFWKMRALLQASAEPFFRPRHKGPLARFRARRIHAVDSSTPQLTLKSIDWAPMTIAELYRARWQVELLFKELKQTLRLRDFYGENRNAVEWQVWTALLVHLLLRYLAFQSRWRGSHTRFAGVVKAAAWERTDLLALLSAYGTAPPRDGMSDGAKTPCLPGFERFFLRSMGQHTA